MSGPRTIPPLLALLALAISVGASRGSAVPAASAAPAPRTSPPASSPTASRVVSLGPSFTSILLALDARNSLVGVDDESARELPAVGALPRVGGLFNPSLEAIVALKPDLVVWVPSVQQRDLRRRLLGLGVPVLALENTTLDQVLGSIETLGARVGRAQAALQRVEAIQRAFTEMRRAVPAGPRPRAVLVIQRDPLYVAGGGGFLDAMLYAAGAENLAASLEGPYPRVGVEWLIQARPQLILDAAPGPEQSAAHWARWPSLPAVARGAVVCMPQGDTQPGPYLDQAVRWLAQVVRDARPSRDEPGSPAGARDEPGSPAGARPVANAETAPARPPSAP